MALPDGYKAVTVYLSPELIEYLTKYATSKKLARKGTKDKQIKPSLSMAIIDALESIATREIEGSTLPSTLPDNLLSTLPNNLLSNLPDNLLELEQKLTNRIDDLEARITIQNTQIEALRSQLESAKSSLDLEAIKGETIEAIDHQPQTIDRTAKTPTRNSTRIEAYDDLLAETLKLKEDKNYSTKECLEWLEKKGVSMKERTYFKKIKELKERLNNENNHQNSNTNTPDIRSATAEVGENT